MYITKILETTIPGGGTTATFTDSEIPNSLIRVFSTDSNIYPQSISLSGNTLTVTYETISSSLGVAVELVKDNIEIIDALNSTASDKALSAYQGKILYDALNNISVIDNLSDLDDVEITNIEDGQVLAWNDTLQKFVNVDQSGGSGNIDYSTTEQDTGMKWINGKTIYQRSYALVSDLICGSNSWTYTGADATDVELIIDHKCQAYNGTNWGAIEVNFDTVNNVRQFGILNTRNSNISVRYLTVQYTKTTDTANT